MKKAITLVMALLIGVLSGCSDFLYTEYRDSTPHVKKEDSSQTAASPDSEVFIETGGIDDLSAAVLDLIRRQAEYGIIRIASYEGDINADAETVCLDAAYNTPYGAYTVYYVSFAVNKYVPFSEVKVYLTYKDGVKERSEIAAADSEETARIHLEEILRSFGGTFTIYTTAPEINAEYLVDCVEDIYFSGNVWLPVMPAIAATSYPETGDERIVELKLGYPYSTYRMNTMRTKTEEALAEIVTQLEGLDERAAVSRLCEMLSEECEYVGYGTTTGEYDRRSDKYTAYGALALGRASGEGYAMAVQLVCRELGIESVVVHGRHENVAHAWNIININGDYYHVDASLQAEKGTYNTFMLNDDRFAKSYFWDLDMYPACSVDRIAAQTPAVNTPVEEEPPVDEEPDTGEESPAPDNTGAPEEDSGDTAPDTETGTEEGEAGEPTPQADAAEESEDAGASDGT